MINQTLESNIFSSLIVEATATKALKQILAVYIGSSEKCPLKDQSADDCVANTVNMRCLKPNSPTV